MAKIVCSTSVFTPWKSLWDFCNFQRKAIIVWKNFIFQSGVGVGNEYQWIRNGACVMVRKPPYSFKRLVNVYKVQFKRLQIKR